MRNARRMFNNPDEMVKNMKPLANNLKESFLERNATTMGKISTGFMVYDAVSTYGRYRDEGSGVVGSAAKTSIELGAEAALGGGVYMAMNLAPALTMAGIQGAMSLNRMQRSTNSQRNKVFGSQTFNETEQTFTMRQAGMNLINQHNNSKRVLLGNEAAAMHR